MGEPNDSPRRDLPALALATAVAPAFAGGFALAACPDLRSLGSFAGFLADPPTGFVFVVLFTWAVFCNLLADAVAFIRWKAGMTRTFEENIIRPSHHFADRPYVNRRPQKYLVYFPLLLAAAAYAALHVAAARCG